MKKNNRDEAIAWLILRCIFLLITILFISLGIIWKPACTSDKEFLGCLLTGSVFDIIGSAMFIGGMVWISGIVKGISNLYNPPGSSQWNYICFAGMVIGVILFWFL